MLSQSDRTILEALAHRIREEFPRAKILAFGSRTRGDATEESDFDICVLLEKMTREDERLIGHLAWEVAFDSGQVFNVLPFTTEEFENGPMSESTLRAHIFREGIAV